MRDANHRAVRAVAMLELLKGVLVLLVASGLMSLAHEDIQVVASMLVQHAHLNPASHYPQLFLHVAESIKPSELHWAAAGALLYSSIRFIEAWGLFRGMAWAEVLGAVSAGIYIPFEIIELVRDASVFGIVLLLLNIVIVYIMLRALTAQRSVKLQSQSS